LSSHQENLTNIKNTGLLLIYTFSQNLLSTYIFQNFTNTPFPCPMFRPNFLRF